MIEVLEKYKDRLVNFSARNQTLCRSKLYKARAFDLAKLPLEGKCQPENILDSLINDDNKEHQLLGSILDIRLTKKEEEEVIADFEKSLGRVVIKSNFTTEEIKILKNREDSELEEKAINILLEKKLEDKKADFAALSKNLDKLFNEIDLKEREVGLYELYIGYPFIEGKLLDGKTVRAPLFLFPSSIKKREGKWYYKNLNEEKIYINKAFLLAYKESFEANIDHIPEEYEEVEEFFQCEESIKELSTFIEHCLKWGNDNNIKIDNSQFQSKVQKCLDMVKKDYNVYKNGELILKNHLVLGQYSIGSNGIFKDIERMIEEKELPDSVVNIIDQDTEVASGSATGFNVKTEEIIESECYFVTELDSSQEKAVKLSESKDNLVIYGPPGTGKSQVIANIVSDNLAKGKKVLVVSEKRTALDVVYKRLEKVNLSEKIAFVHDKKVDREKVMEKILASYDSAASFNKIESKAIDEHSADIEKRLEELQELARELHKKRECGASLHTLYNLSNKQEKIVEDIEDSFHKLKDIDYSKLKNLANILKELESGISFDKNEISQRRSFAELTSGHQRKILKVLGKLESLEKKGIISSLKGFEEELKSFDYQLKWLDENKELKERYKEVDSLLELTAEYKDLFFLSLKRFSIKGKLKGKINFKNLDSEIEELLEIKRLREVNIRLEEMLKNRDNGIEEIAKIFSNEEIPIKSLKDGYKRHESGIEEVIHALEECRSFFNEDFVKLYMNSKVDIIEIQKLVDSSFSLIKNYDYKKEALEKDEDFIFQMFKESVEVTISSIKNTFYTLWLEEIERTNGQILNTIEDYKDIQKEVYELISLKRKKVPNYIRSYLNSEIFNNFKYNNAKSEIRYKKILDEAKRKRKKKSLRNYINLFYKDGLFDLLPCWLLTAEAVSDIMPLEKGLFDLVIFDEASQMFIEKSIPTIYRSKSVVVAGDDKQLKPTSVGLKRLVEEDEYDEEEYFDDSATEAESLLDLAKKRYSASLLNYHYRSKYPELINFSNYAFYDGKLITAPNKERKVIPPIEVIKLNDGIWEGNINIPEVERVYELVKELLINRENRESIGIVTFNSKQQEKIKEYLDDICSEDFEFRALYEEEKIRYDDNEDQSLFVKNIENVQGDERDIIIFSTAYAVDSKLGRVPSRFGSLSQGGGENRLNVAISRAKKKVYVVTSIEPEDLSVETTKNNGPKLLKKYLQYCRAISNNDLDQGEKILNTLCHSPSEVEGEIIDHFDSPFEEEVCEKLREKGYTVHTQIGDSGYKIDLGVYDAKTSNYILGIECDGATYHSAPSARERDIFRQKFLEIKGWNIHRIWSRNWWQNSDKEIDLIVKKVENLIR